jgi:Protein of unknown function (DUF3987)
MKIQEDPAEDFSDFSSFSGGEEVILNEPPRPLMRALPPATEYPVEALGPIMRAAVDGIHDKTQAAIALCAQSCLTTGALATQLHHDVELPTGQTRPTSIFAVSLAESGDRKSSADEYATWAITQREKALRDLYDAELPAYEIERQAYTAARDAILKKCKNDRAKTISELEALGPSPAPPLEPLLTAPEPTFEGLCKLLALGQPGVGVFSGEGGQFIAGYAMNQDNRIKTAAGLSILWDCGAVKRIRVGDGVTALMGRRVSMHLMVQPGVAATLLGDASLKDQGLLSRLLVAAPSSTAGTRFWRHPSAQSDASIRCFGKRVLSLLEAPVTMDRTGTGLLPNALILSPRAAKIWVSFFDSIERQIGPGGDLDQVRGLANKVPEHATRIAGIITTVESGNVGGGEIDEHCMAAGIDIAQYHLSEALRLFEANRANPDLMDAQRLLDWLHAGWTEPIVSLPDIYQGGPNSIRTKKRAETLVSILIDHGWLVNAGSNEVRGTRRRETFRIVRAEQ